MSKQHNIRWRKNDNAELRRVVKNFNAKITRQLKKNPELEKALPDKVSVKELKKDIATRKDLNFYLNKMKRFSEKGAEEIVKSDKGAISTKWAVQEFEREQKAENRRRKKREKELGEKEVTVSNKPTGAKRKEMGKIKENEVKEHKGKFKNKSQEEWEKASKLMEKRMTDAYSQDKKKQMLENYVKGLISEGYSDKLLKMLDKVPIEKFLELNDTDENASFGFIYDPIELKAREDYLIELWGAHMDANTNNQINYGAIVKQVVNEKAALYG